MSGGFTYPPGFDPSPAGFFVDPNFGGQQATPQIVNMSWGRLVDVFDRHPVTGVSALQHRDYVIGEDIITDGVDFRLAINPVTEQATLTILHKAGTAAFESAFDRLDDNLGPVQPKSLEPTELPPFSFIPRNAALVIQFSDLLDHDSVTPETLQVRVGYPAESPFESRILVDPNYGGLVSLPNGKQQFRSSRVVVDSTVSEVESQAGDTTAKINSVGLPASLDTAQPNVAVRIPTQLSAAAGQFELLQNYSGHAITTVSNGPVDGSSPTLDLVRAMRSGGETQVTGDQNNGFLLDLNAPAVLGAQPMSVTNVLPDPQLGGDNYIVSVQFISTGCAQTPAVGDVIEQPGVFAEVTQPGNPPSSGLVSDIRVRLLSNNPNSFIPGPGVYNSTFTGADLPECFVTISPTPLAFPNAGVSPNSVLTVKFTEPMDPASVNVFDTFICTRSQDVSNLTDIVVGTVVPSSDLREFRYVPMLPFAHSTGSAEDYFLTLTTGEEGITDLAGNTLATEFPSVSFTIDPAAPTERNGGVVLRFTEPDEDGNGDPEIRGQFLFDAERGLIRPRPVSRFSAVADRTQAVPSVMIPFPQGVQTPLSPLGSRMMTLYRYFDVGFSATDEFNHNIDVEGMAWSPAGGQVVFDHYDEFEMTLSHSKWLPDEVVNAISLLPQYPNSGLRNTDFATSNPLDDPLNPVFVVHPREKGYEVNPLDLFTASTGTLMMPYPLNRDPDPGDDIFWTWRDTAVRAVGASNGAGIDPTILQQVGLADSIGDIAGPGNVPSFGLPILMEFKCYPDNSALGLNPFDISIAINSSAKPTFRIFSTGGFNTSGAAVVKNPDGENKPDGGFNPGSNPPGKTTPPDDPVFYMGQLDIVHRVSRVYTMFLNADNDPNPNYLEPVMEPELDAQPTGTDIILAFRGASLVGSSVDGSPASNADDLDAYGDQADNNGSGLPGDPNEKNSDVTFFPSGDDTWKGDIDDVDGAAFFQVRMTFINNVASGLSAELSALGFSFEKSGV